MKKSTPTPQKLFKERIMKNQLMKIPLHDRNNICKENNNPAPLQNVERKIYKPHDRQLKDEDPQNPFNVPDHMRIFSRSSGQRAIRPEPFIMSELHTICDVDSTFYKIIEGRPLRQFSDVKVYMSNIRDITLFRADTAYLKDQILQIHTALTDEAVEFDRIDILFNKTKISFVQFAKESYEKAKTVQMIAEEKSIELAKMTDQLECYSFEYVKIRNKLSALVATFEPLSKYRKFLDKMSPYTWREKHDKNFMRSSADSIENMVQPVASSSAALMDIYRNSVHDLQQAPLPLYFKRPKQLMLIFDDLGRQCLNYMQIEDFSNKILMSVLNSHDYLKESVTAEINEMKGFVEIYENHVAWLEGKEIENKSVFDNLLKNSFYKLYASYDTTKLHTCVQYVNTQIFAGPEDPKDKISTLMLHLESLYIELTSGLDNLNQEVVKAATTEMFTEDIKLMKRAHMAQRTIRECDILTKALYTSYEPPRVIMKK